MKITKKVIPLFLFSAFIFLADSAMALTKWTKPPKPSKVPTDFDKAIMNLINWILGFVTMVCVLALIWGGVNYLTSAGDEDKIKTGKKVMEYAIMGIIVCGFAYAIVVVIVGTILKP